MHCQIHVRVDGQDDVVVLPTTGDIADLVWELEQQLKSRHPTLQQRPYLTAELASRIVPELIHDPEEVDLGELS